MKKDILFLIGMLFLSISLSAQLYVDAESASFNSNGDLTDNGRTLLIAKQGDNISNPFISQVNRTGGHSASYQILGATTGSTSQRSESAIIHYSSPVNISDGTVRYTGFSFHLAPDIWSWPTDWFVIHQIQQSPNLGQTINWPIIELELLGSTLAIRGASGPDGSQAQTITKNAITLQQSVWYDVVIGWKFSPNSPNGWVNLWVKTASTNTYTQYAMTGIKLGYSQTASQIFQNKFGIYRARVNASNKMYFDEVRWGGSFDEVKFPGSIKLAPEISTSIDSYSETSSNKRNFCVSPNPVSVNSVLQIDLKTKANEHIIVSVTNSIGRLINKKELGVFQEGNSNIKLDVRSMNIASPGIYFFKISGATERIEKVVVN